MIFSNQILKYGFFGIYLLVCKLFVERKLLESFGKLPDDFYYYLTPYLRLWVSPGHAWFLINISTNISELFDKETYLLLLRSMIPIGHSYIDRYIVLNDETRKKIWREVSPGHGFIHYITISIYLQKIRLKRHYCFVSSQPPPSMLYSVKKRAT